MQTSVDGWRDYQAALVVFNYQSFSTRDPFTIKNLINTLTGDTCKLISGQYSGAQLSSAFGSGLRSRIPACRRKFAVTIPIWLLSQGEWVQGHLSLCRQTGTRTESYISSMMCYPFSFAMGTGHAITPCAHPIMAGTALRTRMMWNMHAKSL